jgi:hypothetical protein
MSVLFEFATAVRTATMRAVRLCASSVSRIITQDDMAWYHAYAANTLLARNGLAQTESRCSMISGSTDINGAIAIDEF